MLRWLSIGLVAICSLVLFRIGVLAPRRVTINANEGWNAYHAADVIAGRPLYSNPPGLFPTPYPPLSFYVVGAVGTLTGGDTMLAGRVVSLLSFVIWAVALALTARRLGCTWAESTCAAALLVVTMLVFTDYYVGVEDPQMLGLAVAAFAPWLLLREPRTHGALWGSALLFTLSIFTKHNLVAIPLACVLWLLWYDRRAGWRLMGDGALLAVAAVAGCVAAFGPVFLTHMLSPRPYTIGRVVTMITGWIPRLALPLAVLVMLIRRAGHDRQVMFGVLLAVISIAVATAGFGTAGVYWNATFDAAWALSLTAALALNRLPAVIRVPRVQLHAAIVAGFLIAPALELAGSATIHWASPRFWLDPRWSEVNSTEQEIAFLEAHPGRALCENMALCYWAGKPPEVDFPDALESFRRDPHSIEGLLGLLESRRFGVAQIDDEPRHHFGPRFEEALRRNYRLDHKGRSGSLLLPR